MTSSTTWSACSATAASRLTASTRSSAATPWNCWAGCSDRYLHRRGWAARLSSTAARLSRDRGREGAFMPADHVHFNGSVNLTDAESVMREIAARVPSGLRRIPDGETGDRGNWIFFQLQKFLQLPWLVTARAMGEEDGEYEQLP